MFLQYGVDLACNPCPESVNDINLIVLVTSVVGGVSTFVCLAVIATIFAHGVDQESLRDRIIVGLMLANAVCVNATQSVVSKPACFCRSLLLHSL